MKRYDYNYSQTDFEGDENYKGNDFIDEMLIDDPIENVRENLEGEFNVKNVVQYYLDCLAEGEIYLSKNQVGYLEKLVSEWFNE